MTVIRMESTEILNFDSIFKDRSGAFIECTTKHNTQIMESTQRRIL